MFVAMNHDIACRLGAAPNGRHGFRKNRLIFDANHLGLLMGAVMAMRADCVNLVSIARKGYRLKNLESWV